MTALIAGTRAPAFSVLASSRDAGEQQVSLTEKDFRGRPLILDGAFCHQAFARDHKLRFPLLADFEPKGRMATDYGVYRAANGTGERALFVIDGNGVIRWSHVSPVDVNPGADGILHALEAMRVETDQADGAIGLDVATTVPIDLVEFGDYECPYCRKAHPIVRQLKQLFGDRLHFRFRNFPLSQIHPHAKHAAEAAVSVRSQAGEGAFWAMHDAIFTHQRDGIDALDDEHLARYAEEVGVHSAQVLSDPGDGEVRRDRGGGFPGRRAHGSEWDADVLHQWRAIRRRLAGHRPTRGGDRGGGCQLDTGRGTLSPDALRAATAVAKATTAAAELMLGVLADDQGR